MGVQFPTPMAQRYRRRNFKYVELFYKEILRRKKVSGFGKTLNCLLKIVRTMKMRIKLLNFPLNFLKILLMDNFN